jgi:hypothetical protein
MWRKSNPEKRKLQDFRSNLRKRAKKYGFNSVSELKSYLSAPSSCEICGEISSRMGIDHNHKAGKIRGILCHYCNSALGLFKDSPLLLDKAKKYLTRGDL